MPTTPSWSDWGRRSCMQWFWWSRGPLGCTETGGEPWPKQDNNMGRVTELPFIYFPEHSACRKAFLRMRRAAIVLQRNWRAHKERQKVLKEPLQNSQLCHAFWGNSPHLLSLVQTAPARSEAAEGGQEASGCSRHHPKTRTYSACEVNLDVDIDVQL